MKTITIAAKGQQGIPTVHAIGRLGISRNRTAYVGTKAGLRAALNHIKKTGHIIAGEAVGQSVVLEVRK